MEGYRAELTSFWQWWPVCRLMRFSGTCHVSDC